MSTTEQQLQRLLLERELEQFLYLEAELLDQRRYEDWLELLTEDVHYWMPMHRNVRHGDWDRETTRPAADMNWFDEGKSTLSQRVRQIRTGVHWAEEPVSRTCHMISNVRLLTVQPEAGPPEAATVECRFLVYRNRQETETDIFIGKRQDMLRRVKGDWRIAGRKIVLDQNVLLAKNMTVFF
jgi:3-phenylpropionate/cinnamic acid dioxygenase small subunit